MYFSPIKDLSLLKRKRWLDINKSYFEEILDNEIKKAAKRFPRAHKSDKYRMLCHLIVETAK
jgi:hypothetical protein